MARGKKRDEVDHTATISLVGPGMEVVGDCSTDGTLRVEGSITGTIYAGKAIVVGKEGFIDGEIRTHDAVISGGVKGSIQVASRLEVHATSRIDGTVHTRRLQLEEGAVLNGEIHMEEVELGPRPSFREGVAASKAEPHPPSEGKSPEKGETDDGVVAKDEGVTEPVQ